MNHYQICNISINNNFQHPFSIFSFQWKLFGGGKIVILREHKYLTNKFCIFSFQYENFHLIVGCEIFILNSIKLSYSCSLKCIFRSKPYTKIVFLIQHKFLWIFLRCLSLDTPQAEEEIPKRKVYLFTLRHKINYFPITSRFWLTKENSLCFPALRHMLINFI